MNRRSLIITGILMFMVVIVGHAQIVPTTVPSEGTIIVPEPIPGRLGPQPFYSYDGLHLISMKVRNKDGAIVDLYCNVDRKDCHRLAPGEYGFWVLPKTDSKAYKCDAKYSLTISSPRALAGDVFFVVSTLPKDSCRNTAR